MANCTCPQLEHNDGHHSSYCPAVVVLRNNPGWPEDKDLPLEFIQWLLEMLEADPMSYDQIKACYMQFKSVRNGAW